MVLTDEVLASFVGGWIDIISVDEPPTWTRSRIKSAVMTTDHNSERAISLEYSGMTQLSATGEWQAAGDGRHLIRLSQALPEYMDEDGRLVIDFTLDPIAPFTILLTPSGREAMDSFITCKAAYDDEGGMSVYQVVVATKPDENGKFLSTSLCKKIIEKV